MERRTPQPERIQRLASVTKGWGEWGSFCDKQEEHCPPLWSWADSEAFTWKGNAGYSAVNYAKATFSDRRKACRESGREVYSIVSFSIVILISLT